MSVLSSLVCSNNNRTFSQKGAPYFNSNPKLATSREKYRGSGAGKRLHPLHWVLLTSHVVETFDQAYEVLGIYERHH